MARLTNYMELPERRILMNALFKAQFNYCPIVWMLHSRSLNNKINRLHERCFRIIYNDKLEQIPDDVKMINSLVKFEKEIRKW